MNDPVGDAVTLFDHEDFEGCLALLHKARAEASEPLPTDAWFFEGLCHRRLGDGEKAADALARAVEESPHDPEYLLEYGLTLIHVKRVQGGLDCLRQAVHESGHDPRYRHELYVRNALALFDEGYVEPCILSLQKALRFVQSPDTYRLLGEILIEEKRHEEAATLLQEALERYPEDPEMHHMAGLALALGKRPYEAVKVLVRACELAPLDPDPLHSLGTCLERVGDRERALEVFRWCLELSPPPLLLADVTDRMARLSA